MDQRGPELAADGLTWRARIETEMMATSYVFLANVIRRDQEYQCSAEKW
jgi:hypothetical protein